MFSHQVGGEKPQQSNDRQRKCYPVKARVDGNAEYCSCKGQDRTHNELTEYIREQQYDQQAANRGKKERFSPQRDARIGYQRADKPKCFSDMKEDVQALWTRALAIESL